MAKKKINKQKAFISTLLWTIIYFALILYYAYHTTGINLLKVSDWRYKYDGFIAGQWSINSSDSLLFLCIVILFIPIWIIGSIALYKINWSVPKFTKMREKSFKQKLVLKRSNALSSKLKMPIKLKIQSDAFSSSETQTSTASMQMTTNNPIASDAVLSTIEKDTKSISNIANQILQLSQKYQVDGFLNLTLDGIQIPLALSTPDDMALLVTIVNEPDSFLTADINDDLYADWFSTLGPIPSPVKLVREATKKLCELEDEAKIIPIIVIAGGELSDCQSITQTLNQYGIILTRFNQGKPETLETIEEFFNKILEMKNETSNTVEYNNISETSSEGEQDA